ncbi:acyl-CoA N-acyltransferase [Jimgerdemannia flammicorona]|uniref:Acyl-CoA N-acyltransferase n=1 Tax=Jimgerdemannia flammicorona TaxID=994334 RepID=A0A433QPN1_9FUNG|nr:acyl-CoA N-acyltransferase [Jimgerdemannia flammicorona]
MPTHHVIRQGLPSEDDAVAENFYKMWLDMGYSSDSLVENWRQKTLDRLQVARRDLKMMTFVAMAVGDDAAETMVGNAIVQLWDGLHPLILKPTTRLEAYIWGVYVDTLHRKQGLAAQLTQACINYSKGIGCTEIRLFTSDMGRSVYERVGFVDGREMKIKFE